VNRDINNELNELGLNEQERAKMERLLGEFQQTANKQAEQPELFWASMRTQVAARMREPRSHKGLGWAATLAAVSAMVVFVAVPSRTPQHGNVTPTTSTAKTNSSTNDDEALLRSIAETTNSDVPDALAPATVLTSEMDRGLADGKNKSTGRNTQ
jgi:hypothetical protein